MDRDTFELKKSPIVVRYVAIPIAGWYFCRKA